jgi:putative membrane protein
MRLFLQILTISRLEAAYYACHPRLLVAAAAVALIPALYSVLYLSSIWDPAANMGQLGVALVNLDRGLSYQAQQFNVGQEVTDRLKAKHQFGFIDQPDEAAARAQVREGKLAFALIIPADFSSNAIPGAEAGAGKLVVYASEGNSYQSAGLARRFASELGHEVNESLNERRWALVLSSTLGSQRSMERLHQGVQQLQQGAQELAKGTAETAAGSETLSAGAGRLQQGVAQLSAGTRDLGAAVRALDSKRPRGSELNRLKSGAESLAAGHGELGSGLTELQSGAQEIQTSVRSFREQAAANPLLGPAVTPGLDQLALGLSGLDTGLRSAATGQQKLAEGAGRLSEGVGAMVTGVTAMGNGVRAIAAKLPEDSQLEELANGAKSLAVSSVALAAGNSQVNEGAWRLSAGIDMLEKSLPKAIDTPDGSAQGLANSVSPVVEIAAPVQNNGAGFAPNILSGAMWLGAGIAAFLIHVRVLPRQGLFFSRLSQVLGKLLLPAALVLVQSLLLMLCVVYVFKMPPAQPGAFALTLATGALTFLLIIFALTLAFGDVGKAMAMMFLAIQLSSSGGMVPVELSGGIFVEISPWLPLTWEVRAIKASLFGAYAGAWHQPLLWVVLAGSVAVAMACTLGRWRFVRQSAIRPAVQF